MKAKFKYPERDGWIRQMHAAGVAAKDIGVAFGITAEGVKAVLKKLAAEESAIQRSAELLKEFPLADDLDKKWRVDIVLDALLLSTRGRNAIAYWCRWNNVTELSLRELMDLIISDKPHAKDGFLITPLLDVQNIKVHTFWLAVRRLTEVDLGVRCNQEWQRRLQRLILASRIVGGRPLSWSKACEPPAWLRAQLPT